jgi:MucR family transcriptional regulator, transcriptional regulator of exopolysaccharide biosynthesis
MPASECASTRQLTTEIVSAYARRNQLTADQLANVISAVYETLSRLGEPAKEDAVELSPAVPIKRSVQHDNVVCLDCGWRGKMLRRHIQAQHGLSVDEYRARWGLSAEHPLTAPGYSEQRSAFAKQVGLGQRRREDPAPVAATETAGVSGDTDMPRAEYGEE